MISVAFIVRSTLFTVRGGDTIQVEQTAKWLKDAGINAEILLTDSKIDYSRYQLFHFFNLNRPADIVFHIRKIKVPWFITPILVDYSEFDKLHRKGIPGIVLKLFSPSMNEYIKTVARWVGGKDKLISKSYLWMGHTRSIQKILKNCTAILPNSMAEWNMVKEKFRVNKSAFIIANGIDHTIFIPGPEKSRETKTVACVARIEGIKNQLNLIRAVNDSEFTLLIIGSPAQNQGDYFQKCKKLAKGNIIFLNSMSQEELVEYYSSVKVHVLPSWFETCGLSSLEAAAMGCNIVITDKGFTRDYFGDVAFYCDPGNPDSIRIAIQLASRAGVNTEFQNKVLQEFTWQNAAKKTLEAYKRYL